MDKPCEYCGANLPRGVDKKTRQVRSHHFANCTERKRQNAMRELPVHHIPLPLDQIDIAEVASGIVDIDDAPGVAVALAAEVAEYKRDAERYRWLRDPKRSHAVVGYIRDNTGKAENIYEYRLDREIDAALGTKEI